MSANFQTLSVVHVDHTGEPGGGQLGLARYMRLSAQGNQRALFLEGGAVADELVRSGLAEVMPGAGRGGVLALLRSSRSLRRALADVNPSLVVANSLKAAVVLALSGYRDCPITYYIRQDMTRESMGGFKHAVGRALIFPRFDGFFANSRWTKGTIPGNLRRVPVEIAYPVSGTAGIAAAVGAENREVPRLRILSLGRLQDWKGQDVLLKACSALDKRGLAGRLEVTIAGGSIFAAGDYALHLTRLASMTTVPVNFVGHIEDVPKLLREHDLLVHTSKRPEPFGQVIVQGLAAGLPVIATGAGGALEILGDSKAAVLVPPDDVMALTDVIDDLLSDEGRLAAMAHESLALAGRFEDRLMAARFDEAQVRMVDRLGAAAAVE